MRHASRGVSSWPRSASWLLAVVGLAVACGGEISAPQTSREVPREAPRESPLRDSPRKNSLDGSPRRSVILSDAPGSSGPSPALLGAVPSGARRFLGEAVLGRVAELEHLLQRATSALKHQLFGEAQPASLDGSDSQQAGEGVGADVAEAGMATAEPGSEGGNKRAPEAEMGADETLDAGQASTADATNVHVPSVVQGSVCWASPGYSAPEARGGRGGILVQGGGCSVCHVGDACSFFILIQGPAAAWRGVPPLSAFKWDLMVTLRGPSLGHADISMLSADADAHSLMATYRVWDAGLYRVRVRGPCMNLWFPGRRPKSDLVAEWTLQVLPVVEPSSESSLPLVSPSPCDYTLHARWLLQANGTYRWTPFPCSPPWLKARDAPQALVQRRGIREINFVGDSRLRVLALHLYHLFLAGEGNADQATYPYHRVERHGNVSLAVPLTNDVEVDAGQSLLLNFYFADFILSEAEFGCKHLNSSIPHGWMPEVSPTADVTILNVGSWTGTFCKDAELAISSHIEAALRWTNGGAKTGSHVILRSASSMYRGMGCRVTNSFLHFANSVAQAFCPRFGAAYFDTWQIEAPLFSHTCSLHDHHYSCIRRVPGGAAMHGEVGEAVALSFLHFLLHMLR